MQDVCGPIGAWIVAHQADGMSDYRSANNYLSSRMVGSNLHYYSGEKFSGGQNFVCENVTASLARHAVPDHVSEVGRHATRNYALWKTHPYL